jgi:hypothetical protein
VNTYDIDGNRIDSVELKCLLISRGVKVDSAVYRQHNGRARLSVNPLCCNCLLLSDGTIVQLTDTNFHLRYLSGILSWDNLRLLRYIKDLATPFTLRMLDGHPVLYHNDVELDIISFPPASVYFRQKTNAGRPFVGNTVIQGLDWVAFQCLWPCEYAAAGQPCQFCFTGGDCENAVKRGKTFTNFVIGIEDFCTLAEGAQWLSERSIMPAASVWMPMGRPVLGSMKAPEVDYYRRVKEHFANIYVKYKLEPTKSRGLNVCVERDIWNYALL